MIYSIIDPIDFYLNNILLTYIF